ncbi:MAG: 1-acyl-sn-glycerol-3-phosphate acyltransferase [Caldilineaceae bacterium SB0670_bin_27]|uniref:1-acyl-sn-glycerol-3-phosphate acyltransferase n=1 Tax=Caldilineaceae bacterium SB0664_bin_27 TaxID=2605260 RepID=A0A6B0YRN4_9CHLR|nr:1-acyl-sn-glycerol-3-phosphate acyltransferase [Caldilineaceae bacterium SB0664_bin_27]MYJ78756.1 1-acyl-sn-glycerol-3-phosphate acyltransferase [Caldilineaceae bacterium SB0670_bin_27]
MRIPSDASGLWKFCHAALTVLRPLFCSLRVEGVENVPLKGGVVLACNHPGGMDCFVMGFASPRQVFYMAKRELFNIHPVVTFLLYRIGAFPINRGARDIEAIEYSVELLKQGRIVGMFPEGTRNRGRPMRRGKSGAVRIAIEAGVPVVPVAVLEIPHLHKNWLNPFKRTQLSVQFGQPVLFPAGSMEDVQDYTTEIMLEVARMMPPELRGYYGEAPAPSQDGTPPRTPMAGATGPASSDIATG